MEPILNQVHSGDIGRRRKLTTEEELLSVLTRLRLGLLAEDVARRFEVSFSTYSRTFSHYKHHNNFKLLLGISPGGVITFISELW